MRVGVPYILLEEVVRAQRESDRGEGEGTIMADSAGQNKPSPPKDSQGNDIPLNPLVGALVPDPNNRPDSVTLTGYVGLSSKDGFVRIYPELDFGRYYELPADEVLYVQPSDSSHPEIAAKIFVNSSAKIELVQTVEASFLEGAIASAYPIWCATDPCSLPVTTCYKCPVPEGSPHTVGCQVSPDGTTHTVGCPVSPDGTTHTVGCAQPDGGSSRTSGSQTSESKRHSLNRPCAIPEGSTHTSKD
jgi:hypothetical protein